MQMSDRVNLERCLEKMGEECYGSWLPAKELGESDADDAAAAAIAAAAVAQAGVRRI